MDIYQLNNLIIEIETNRCLALLTVCYKGYFYLDH